MQVGLNCESFVDNMKALMIWDEAKLRTLPTDTDVNQIIGVKKELTNDGLLYCKHVRPIFEEALSNVTSFADSWTSHYDNIDTFLDQFTVIERKV